MEVKSASASSDSSIRQPGEVKSFFKRIRSKKGNQVGFYFFRFLCEDDDDVLQRPIGASGIQHSSEILRAGSACPSQFV